MRLDIRIPVGLFFGVVGLLLAGFGALDPGAVATRPAPFNVNLVWGVVLAAFGGAMLAWVRFSPHRPSGSDPGA